MQANQEVLYKLARDYVARKTRGANDLVSVYLTGSVLHDEPLLGGTTDIDLVVVHKEHPVVEREVQRVSYEVSFDIQHHHQSFYAFHRRLRLNPWLGEALCSHDSVLYDTGHWFDYIQAGVSSQYMTPENIYLRAQAFSDKARQEWFELDDPQDIPFSAWVDLYFKVVYAAANAVAVMGGPALTTRRMLLDFPGRAETLGQLNLVGDLNRLVSGVLVRQNSLRNGARFGKKPCWMSANTRIARPICLLPAKPIFWQLWMPSPRAEARMPPSGLCWKVGAVQSKFWVVKDLTKLSGINFWLNWGSARIQELTVPLNWMPLSMLAKKCSPTGKRVTAFRFC